MNCPKCHGERCVKDGIVNGRQRYRCKGCGYRHTVAERGAGVAVRRQTLQLYLEGMGFRAIGRFLEVSHVAVYYWIKAFGEAVGSVGPQHDHRGQGGGNGRVAQLCRA